MLPAVPKVDREPYQQPHEEADPRVPREKGHQRKARGDPEDRYQRHQRRPERAIELRPLVAQDPHAAAHEDEREQRADIHELAEDADREQRREEGDTDAGVDRGEVWCTILWMDLPRPGAEQPV